MSWRNAPIVEQERRPAWAQAPQVGAEQQQAPPPQPAPTQRAPVSQPTTQSRVSSARPQAGGAAPSVRGMGVQTPQQPPMTPQMQGMAQTAAAGFPGGPETYESPFEAARVAATEAGVNPSNSAPLEVRMALAWSAPYADTPEKQLSVARNAFGENAELRIGPDTNQVEYKQPGQNQWSLVNPPGFDLRDIAAAGPEAGVLGLGVVGGIAATGAGGAVSGGNILAATATGTVGLGVAEGMGTLQRLQIAKSLGYIPDATEKEMFQTAYERGKEAMLWTSVGGIISAAARRYLARSLGASPELIDALNDTPDINEAIEKSRAFQRQAEELSGERFPLTAGQVAESPEIRLAEQQAIRTSPEGARLSDIQRQQAAAQARMEENIFGPRLTPEEQERLFNTYAERGRQDVADLTRRLETELDPITSRAAAVPEQAAKVARGQIEIGIDRLYKETFSPRYDAIFATAPTEMVNLAPLNRAAADIQERYGQDVLKSISLTNQRVLKEAKEAGLDVEERLTLQPNNLLEWENTLVEKGVPFNQIQNTLVDIRRELRRPGISDDPQKRAVLRELKAAIETIRNDALPPESKQQILDLDRQYAEAAAKYNESFIADFVQLTPDGTPYVRTDQAFNRLLRSPELADSFVTSMAELPGGDAALAQFRRGVLSNIIEQSTRNGEISDAALNKFLTGPNRRALSVLFQGDEIAEQFDSVSEAARALKTRNNQIQSGTTYVNNLLGQRFIDPSKIGQQTYQNMDNLSVEQVQAARNFLPEAERSLFDRAFANEIRDSFVDGNGRINPQKLGEFLDSRESLAASRMFGDTYVGNLRTLQRAAEVRRPVTRQTADRDISGVLAATFGAPLGFADGIMRAARVPFPPLSVRGRALTASLAQLQTRTQRDLARLLADPERANDLRVLLNTNIYSRTFEKFAFRLGAASFVEYREALIEARDLADSKESEREELEQ